MRASKKSPKWAIQTPLPSAAPRHNRNGRDRILGRSFNQLVTYRKVNQCVALLIDGAEDIRVLEEDLGVVGIDLFVLGQLAEIHIDGPDLPAGD